MRPWAASGGPDADTLRQLRETMTLREIAERYGVTRQTVQYWIRRDAPDLAGKKNQVFPLPWKLRGDDHNDSIPKALRWWEQQRAGMDLTPAQAREVERLLAGLEDGKYVVDYSRDEGFALVRRNPELDEPGDIMRRPREACGV